MTGAYLPTLPVFSSPSCKVCINHEWVTFVLGLLEPGTEQKHWESVLPLGNTLAHRESVAEGIMAVQAVLATVPVPCVEECANCPDGVNFSSVTDFMLNQSPWGVSVGTWAVGEGIRPADVFNSDGFWWQQVSVMLPLGAQQLCLREFVIKYDWDAEFNTAGCGNPLQLSNACNMVRLTASGNAIALANWHTTATFNQWFGFSGFSASGIAMPNVSGSLHIDAWFGRSATQGDPRRGRIRSAEVNGVLIA